MPFTGSHPAAMVPLFSPRFRRLGLPPAALVVGSMVPDTSLFLPGPELYWIAHRPTGIVTVDVALGLAGLALWWAVLGPAARAAAPAAVRRRLAPVAPGPWRARSSTAADGRPGWLARITVALIIGSTSHVVWDEFTHYDRWGFQHIAWLRLTHRGLPGFEWAQHTSTAVGAVVIGMAVWTWWRSAGNRLPDQVTAGATPAGSPVEGADPLSGRAAVGAWLLVIGTGLLAGLLSVGVKVAEGTNRMNTLAFVAATRATTASLAAAVALALIWTARTRLPGRLGRGDEGDRPGQPASGRSR